MTSTITPTSDLNLYSVDVISIGLGANRIWRCRVYFEDARIDSFDVKGGTFKEAEWKAKEQALRIASRQVDIEPRRPRITDAKSYLEVQGD